MTTDNKIKQTKADKLNKTEFKIDKTGIASIPSTIDNGWTAERFNLLYKLATDFFTWVDSSYLKWLINLDLLTWELFLTLIYFTLNSLTN